MPAVPRLPWFTWGKTDKGSLGPSNPQTGTSISEILRMIDTALPSRAPRSASPDAEDATRQRAQTLAGDPSTQKFPGMRAAMAPHRVYIKDIMRQMGQVEAQTEQNIADIGSWFGQYGDLQMQAAGSNRRAGKRAAKQAKSFDKAVMSGLSGHVRSSYAGGSVRGQKNLLRTSRAASDFAANLAAEGAQMGAYQKLVQQRLGMQAQSDLMSELAKARAAKAGAKYEFKQQAIQGQQEDQLRLIGMLPQEIKGPIIGEMLGIPPEAFQGLGEKTTDPTIFGGRLRTALGSVDPFESDSAGGKPTMNLEDIIGSLKAAAASGGFDVNDPAVREMIRKYVEGNILGQYNTKTEGAQYGRAGTGGFYPLGG